MMVRRGKLSRALVRIAAGAALLCSSNTFADSTGATSTVVVDVVGYGSTVNEARADAVRQAMQAALSQLVVSDIAVDGDTVLRDRVQSTMNGFVDRVEETNMRREGDEIVISSRITVSTTRIANFLGLQSAAASVDGLSLLSELNRETEQRSAVAEILARSFRGFPSKAIETTITSIKPSPKNPDEVLIDFSFAPSREWLKSLDDTLQALAVSSHRFSFNTQRGTNNREHYCRDQLLQGKAALVDGWACARNPELSALISKTFEAETNIRPLCLVGPTEATCHVLPSANYQAAFFFTITSDSSLQDSLMFVVAPLDADGNLTTANTCCQTTHASLQSTPDGIQRWMWGDARRLALPWQLNMAAEVPGEGNAPRDFIRVNQIFTGKVPARIVLNRRDLDLARTKSIAIIPVISTADWPGRGGSIFFDVGDGASPPNMQEAVISAAREALLTSGK